MTSPESAPGFTLWLTGLSSGGKTMVPRQVGEELGEPQASADQVIALLESRGVVR